MAQRNLIDGVISQKRPAEICALSDAEHTDATVLDFGTRLDPSTRGKRPTVGATCSTRHTEKAARETCTVCTRCFVLGLPPSR